jgi:hypothetical protein
MLNAIMLKVGMLILVMLNVVMMNLVMLKVFMLNVVKIKVVILNVIMLCIRRYDGCRRGERRGAEKRAKTFGKKS